MMRAEIYYSWSGRALVTIPSPVMRRPLFDGNPRPHPIRPIRPVFQRYAILRRVAGYGAAVLVCRDDSGSVAPRKITQQAVLVVETVADGRRRNRIRAIGLTESTGSGEYCAMVERYEKLLYMH
jgi:hypothetical protein